jgi:chaperone required for assembly of F1-ATPase
VSGWQRKRFWKEVSVVAEAGGFGLRLDDRVLRTPGKAPLVVPGAALAEAVAAEWRAQDGGIDPGAMPFTRMSNSAIEKVAPEAGAVARTVAEYGATDLTCYRAEAPAALVARQAAWDPMLDWAAEALGARLVPTPGVMPVPQDGAALARLGGAVRALGPFELAAFHDLVALSGSLILGFAVARDRLTAAEGWRLSRIDEDWQSEVWGRDDEAAIVADRKFSEFRFAKSYFDLVRNS